MSHRVLGVIALITFGCASPSAQTAAVVYGGDGRTEVFAHPNAALRGAALDSVAVMINARFLDERDPTNIRLRYSRTLGAAETLCAGEPFMDQLEPGSCSGTLIDSQHVLTAGHCVDDSSACTEASLWAFDFAYDSAGTLRTMTAEDVYRCARILAYRDDDTGDHAVVELDRPVVGHRPAAIRSAEVAVGDPLALMGFPDGIPLKIDSSGQVRSVAPTRLRATVDAFQGNSGSGVFDLDGRLLGILNAGAEDYVASGSCFVVNRLAEDRSGEEITRVGLAVSALCATPGLRSPLCDCGGMPCVTAPDGDVCATATPLPVRSGTTPVSLAGFAPDTTGTCGGNGNDRVYTLTVDVLSDVTLTARGGDPVLYLRATCTGAELACNDDVSRSDRAASITATLTPGTYSLFVDSYDAATSMVELTVSVTPVGTVDAAGLPDAWTARPDVYVPPGVDAGPLPDASLPSAPLPTSGCGCAVPVGHRQSSLFGLAIAALVMGRRRRR